MDISSEPIAGPSSAPEVTAKTRRKNKRKHSSIASGQDTPEPFSSANVSKDVTPDADAPTRSKSRKKRSKTKDREKREKERLKSKGESVVNGGDTPSLNENATGSSAHFDGGADFIALADSDDEEDLRRDRKRDKGKGKDTGESSKHEEIRRRSRSRSRERDRRRDRDKYDERDRERDRKGRGRQRTPEREWDKGKRSHDRDRDRDRVVQNDIRRFRNRYDPPVSASVRPLGNRKVPWIEGLDFERCNNVAELLHMEVEAFTKWISPSPVEDEIRGLLVDLIRRAISKKFPDAEIFPFGSYATKLYLPTGDIDLVVLSKQMEYMDKLTVLRSIADSMKRNYIASNVTIIAKAKVPIVKFVATCGHIPVDISINQPNGAVGATIVNGFLKDMSTSTASSSSHLEGSLALRALVMITKMFLSQRSMNEVYTGGLGSYSIVCLVISFLQMHPKIRRGEIDADSNLGVLMMDFFELYGSYFNYENVGISVRDGGTYFNKRQRGWYNDSSNYKGKGPVGSMLSIEDPTDITNDISSGSYGFPKVRATFSGAHKILTATAYLKAGIISARRSGSAIKLRDDYRPEEMSILSHILDVTQDIINHRRIVQEVYDQRTLHNILGVKVKPIVVNGNVATTNGHPSPAKASRDQSGAIPLELSSDLDDKEFGARRRRNDEREDGELEDDEEEEGRYGIGRQPPRKRMKTGGGQDVHTMFTTDDDSSASDASHSDSDSVASEEAEYDVEAKADRSDQKPRSSSESRRSYWLSKGIVGASDE